MLRSNQAVIELPPKLVPILSPPLGSVRQRAAYGGRGGGKSFCFAVMALLFGYQKKIDVLCAREFAVSIRYSFWRELVAALNHYPWLNDFYDVGVKEIVGKNGTMFAFKGLRMNINNIKGMSNFDICILEEAEELSSTVWSVLPPTIRKPGSEIWSMHNPGKKGSPTDIQIIQKPPRNALITDIQYYDNPFFSDILNEQRLRDKEIYSKERYNHIWEGRYLEISDAQIFKDKYVVEEFTPGRDWEGPYQGLDFGFSQDPTAAVRFWRHNEVLYIEYESGDTHLELDRTVDYINNEIPDFYLHKIIADSARPESIDYLKRHGFPYITAAKKGKGSVEDGIAGIRAHKKVVIHPRCGNSYYEFKHYEYKKDQHSQEILANPIDANNHYIDAIRYGLEQVNSLVDYRKILGEY